jgi:DNA-binding SARP family transcriptional activator
VLHYSSPHGNSQQGKDGLMSQPSAHTPLSVAEFVTESLPLDGSEEIAVSLRRAQQALDAARALGEPSALAEAMVCVARMRFRLGQYGPATDLAQEALALAAPDAPVRADAWQVLGNCASETNSLTEAETFYRQAADLAREIGYHRGQGAALHGLAAGVYLSRGQFDLALATDEEARAIASKQDRREWIVYPLITISMICQLTDQRERAQATLDELGRLATAGSIVQGYHLCTSAALALDEGELEAARGRYTQARSIAEASGEPWLNVSVRLGMSRYHRLAWDGPNARTWAADALTFATRVGYRHEQAKALIERGRAVWLCDNGADAEADLRAATEILEELGAAFDLARARFLLAALLHQQSRAGAAAAWLDAARSIVEGGYAFLLEQERALAFPLLAAHQNSPDVTLARSCALLLDRLGRVPPPVLRIVTLGRFEVWQGVRCVPKQALRQRRAGDLLALLLLASGRCLSFDQLAEVLFPDKEPSAAQVLFHHATSALRRALEPDLPDKFPSRYLEVEDGQVTLHLPPGSRLDLETFEAHCRQGEWEEAMILYRGDLLPDYRYADWALAPRERLALLYQRALLAAAEAWLAEGQSVEALDACQHLLALEPWHERAALLGMRACVALNDLATARRLYLKLEKTLHEELDTAPQPELHALYRSLTPPSS